MAWFLNAHIYTTLAFFSSFVRVPVVGLAQKKIFLKLILYNYNMYITIYMRLQIEHTTLKAHSAFVYCVCKSYSQFPQTTVRI